MAIMPRRSRTIPEALRTLLFTRTKLPPPWPPSTSSGPGAEDSSASKQEEEDQVACGDSINSTLPSLRIRKLLSQVQTAGGGGGVGSVRIEQYSIYRV